MGLNAFAGAKQLVSAILNLALLPITVLSKNLAILAVDDREYFYTILGESVISNITFATIFDQIEEDTPSQKLVRLARVARRGLVEQKADFTTYFAESGLLPREEIALLKIGVRRDSIPSICAYLVAQNIQSISFDSYFLKNAGQWMISVPISMLAVGYFGHVFRSIRRASEGDLHIFFYIYDWLIVWWPWVLIITVLLIVCHRVAQPYWRLGRAIAHKFYIFKLYDAQWEMRLARLCAVLVPTGLSHVDLLSQLATVAKGNRQLYVKIMRAARISSEKELLDLLPIFLSRGVVSKVKAKSPNGTPPEIGGGFEMASRIGNVSLEKQIKSATGVLSMIFMIISMVFFGPLIAISSGL